MKNKFLLTLLLYFCATMVPAQMHVGIAAGSGTDKTIVTDLRIGYHSNKFLAEASEILSFSDDKPCYFGARLGKIIQLSPESFLIPVAGVYYSVFTNDNTIKAENCNGDESLINKFVPAIGMIYVTGKYSIELRQLNNTLQLTIGLWNILKTKS